MTTLTHFPTCTVIASWMTAVRCEAANALATHDHARYCNDNTMTTSGGSHE